MKLYSPEGHYKTNRILVVGDYAGASLQLVPSTFNNSPSKDFIKKYPNARLPALETSEGFLFGAATIIRYLTDISSGTFRVDDMHQRTLVDQWVDFSEAELEKHAGVLYLQMFGLVPYDADRWNISKKELNNSLKFLDSSLKTSSYLSGDRLTSGDLSVAGVLQISFRTLLNSKIRAQYPHLTRWFVHVSSLPPFVNNFGKSHLCQEEFRFHEKKE